MNHNVKKYFLITLLSLFVGTFCYAQNNAKFGHINYAQMLQLIPGFDTAQTNIMNYQTELQEQGELMAQEFQNKQQELQKYAAAPSITPAILKIKQEELQKMYQRIQEYSQSIETLVYERQAELLKPFQELLTEAIKKVAKAEKYTYIFDAQALHAYQLGNDISEQVKKELNITDTPSASETPDK